MDYLALIGVGIAVIYLAMSIRIVSEDERFAVFIFGRFTGLKGPGLLLRLPGSSSKFSRIALGAEGEVQSNELASFEGGPIPYKASPSVRVGTKIKVTSFEKTAVHVEPIRELIVCEKCGHKNPV